MIVRSHGHLSIGTRSVGAVLLEAFEWLRLASARSNSGPPGRASVARLGVSAVLRSPTVRRCPGGALFFRLAIRFGGASPPLVAVPAAPAPLVYNCHGNDGGQKYQLQPPWLRRRFKRERGAEERGQTWGVADVMADGVRGVGEEDERASGAEKRG
jgi:hypothetical protein